MSERKKPARWRKQPPETGLRRVGQQERGYDLRVDGEEIIRVRPSGGDWAEPLRGWYWYGLGVNTYNTKPLFQTAELAKADADSAYKKGELK